MGRRELTEAFTKSKCRWLFLAVVAVAAVAVFAATPASAQSVTTDQSEYRPGNIVTIIGSDWAPGETISLLISENPAKHPDVSLSATADTNGYFENPEFSVPDNSPDTIYTVTASGSSAWTAQAAFTDPGVTGSLCAAVVGHGASVCPSATGASGVLGTGQTHYAQVAGSMATYEIRWTATETPDYVSGNGCAATEVRVRIKSSLQGNTDVCGTLSAFTTNAPNGSIITFTWSAPEGACQTTIVAYGAGLTGGRTPQLQFTNSNGGIIEDNNDVNADPNSSAGIGYVAAGNPNGPAISCTSVTTEIHKNSDHSTAVTQVTDQDMAHDKATVTGPGCTGDFPTGTVAFTLFSDANCTTGSTSAGTVTLVNGVADPSDAFGPLLAGSYSFKAHYNGGTCSTNGQVEYDPAGSACEPLEVLTAGPITGNLTACKYEDSDVNGRNTNNSEPALNGWSMTISPTTGGNPEPATQSTGTGMNAATPGCVTWTNLTPGTYSVTEAPPAGGTPWFNTDPGPLCLIAGSSVMGWPTCATPSKTGISVTDGVTSTVSFGNIQSAEKHGQKFYDANANATNDDNQGVNNWTITLSGAAVNGSTTVASMTLPLVTLTRNDPNSGKAGIYWFVELLPGSYTVTEGTPTQSSWMHTTATSIDFALTPGEVEEHNDFGNLCVGAGGGLTLGFWSNKNGQALLTAADFSALATLKLVNANGSDRDFTSSLSTNKTDFRSWLLSATATNMAYMLSAQLAAMKLNVLHSSVTGISGSSLVFAPGCGNTGVDVTGDSKGDFISINGLITAANAALLADHSTPAGDPNRAPQECLKNALDRANNSLNFVQPTPTTCPGPTFP